MTKKLNKWLLLLLIGIFPTLLGYLFNNLIMTLPINSFVMFMFNFLFYLYWFLAGYKIKQNYEFDFVTVLYVHAVGIISLAAMGFQLALNGGFMMNIWGLLPQLYFIPSLYIVTRIDIFNLLTDILKMSTMSLIIMIIIFYAGSRFYVKRQK